MSEMKNYMMDIEEFCDSHFFGVDSASEVEIEEVAEEAKKFFGTFMAKDYARKYLTKTLGEI